MKAVPKTYEISQGIERMDWATGFISVAYGFVYRVVGHMTREPIPGFAKGPGMDFGTMGVCVKSGNVHLKYDPLFAMLLSDAEITFVLYHEILHIVLHHCTCRQFDDKNIGNMAMDLAVNSLIPVRAGSCEAPVDAKTGKRMGCFVEDIRNDSKNFPGCKDIQDNQTAEYYYDYLMKHLPKQSGKGSGQGSGEQRQFDDHSGHAEDEIASERVRAIVKDIEAHDGWGSVSTSVKEVVLAAQVPKINWRNVLRQFYGNISWAERVSTRKRPNRRTGMIHPGNRKLQLDRHLVVADTSGSIDSLLLSEFLSVVNQISEQQPIDFAQVDCEKQSEPRPWSHRERQLEFLGRGGTDFAPIMKMVEERRYKSVVILTDGEAGPVAQPNARVVWVLPKGKNPPVDWGLRVHMERHV
jgi:predicted metal-dependent peptidase